MTIRVEKGEAGWLRVRFSYSHEQLARIREILGRQWVQKDKIWIVPDNEESMRQLIAAFGSGLVFGPGLTPKIDGPEQGTSLPVVLKRLEMELKIRSYSRRTVKAYLGHVERFLEQTGKPVTEMNSDDVKRYVYQLIERQKASYSYANQAISAIRFLFNHVINAGENIGGIPRPKKEQKLPDVLNTQEVAGILDAVANSSTVPSCF